MRRISILVLLLAGACGVIGVSRQSKESWLERSHRSILTTTDVSAVTFNILRRRGLTETYRSDPVGAITALQKEMASSRERELAVAIAELGYLQSRRWTNVERRALATTIRYSYAYLFDPKLKPEPQQFDALYRWACDLHTTAMADLIRATRREADEERPRRSIEWYGGRSDMRVGTNQLTWSLAEYDELHVAYDYVVEGLPQPDSRRGFGVPCILRRAWNREAAVRGLEASRFRFLPPKLGFSATFVARYPDGTSVLDEEQPELLLEIYDPTRTTHVDIEGVHVPLEIDYITPVAAMLSEGHQQLGIAALFDGRAYEKQGGLYMFQPYEKGKIFVLLVHGLASDPYTWLPLYADLLSNETIRTRYQFAFWFYPTGQPALYSSAQLRQALVEAYDALDPDRDDDARRHTVVCGHSMGGILTRSLVVDSGTKLWDIVFDRPPEELQLSDDDRRFVRDLFIFEPLPFVRRAIFYATPHRGSPLARRGLAEWASGLLSLPSRLLDPANRIRRQARPRYRVNTNMTSVQTLRDDNPILLALADLPIDPRVTYHSIIGDEDAAGRTGGSDGIVPYASSHVEGAESELVVHSGHSVQRTPQAARETIRILLEHLAAYDAERAAR